MNSADIKNFVFQRGAVLCGIAHIDRFNDAPQGFGPLDLYPQTQSVISFALQVPKSTLALKTGIPYTVGEIVSLQNSHRMALDLVLYLENKGYEAVMVPSEPYEYWDVERRTGKGLVSLKHIANRCGLGVFGKNHLLYNAQYGSLMRLGAILTNARLDADPMLDKEICKSSCKLCVTSCPAGAISESGVDQLKCRSFCEGKTAKGDLIYTCNLCRRICPNVSGVKVNTKSVEASL